MKIQEQGTVNNASFSLLSSCHVMGTTHTHVYTNTHIHTSIYFHLFNIPTGKVWSQFKYEKLESKGLRSCPRSHNQHVVVLLKPASSREPAELTCNRHVIQRPIFQVLCGNMGLTRQWALFGSRLGHWFPLTLCLTHGLTQIRGNNIRSRTNR